MKIRAALMGSICASAIAFPAYAQDTGDTDDEVLADENVIIVTATLRASDIQDVPIAVTAVQPAELQRQGIQDIKSLSSVSPSFNIQSSQTETQGTSIRIRGVGTTGNNTGLESSVGVFIDGVYQSRPGIALGDLLDLERLEILRGPQGTLFGRNTSAGALNIATKRPDLNEIEGFANATFGNLGYYGAQAGVSVPVIQDEMGIRLSGAYRKRDGYIVSSVSGAESGNRDRFILRGQMLWEPTADMSLRLIGDYAESDENCCTAVIIKETPYRDLGAFAAYGLPANGGVIDYGRDAVQNRISSDDGYINTTKQWGVSGQLDYNLGAAELTYIGSFRNFKAQSAQDDFVGVDVYQVGPSPFSGPNFPFSGGTNEVMTHELRLKGTFGDDAVDWLIGAYYSDEQIDEIQAMTLGGDYQAYASNALFPLLGNNFAAFGPNPLFGFTRLAQATGFTVIPGLGPVPNAALPNVVGVDAAGSYAINEFTQDAKSFSVFTHNVISFTDELSLTLGARYVDESKDGAFNQLDASSPACATIANGFGNVVTNLVDLGLPAGTAQALAGAGLGLTCFPFTAEANLPASAVLPLPREYDLTFEDNELTYTAQLAYNVGDFLGYASFSHGFKSGGFNLDPAASAGGADPRFDSEKVDAYEVGMKTSLANRQITANLALFHMEMTDFQVLEFTGVQFQTFNVASAMSTGAELELVGRFDPYMTINLSGTYANARYADDCDAGITGSALATVQVLCGQPLTNAPKFSGVAGITYDGPINSSGWGLLANMNVYYSGDRRTSTTPTETAAPFAPLPFDYQEAYFKINARLGFSSPNDRFAVELWGLNLSNEITRGITANTPLRGGSGNRSRIAFLEEPRTYGVTVRTKF